MQLTRRAFLLAAGAGAVATALGAGSSVAGASPPPPRRAGALRSLRWGMPASAFHNLANPRLGGDPGLADALFAGPGTWFVTDRDDRGTPVPAGCDGVAVLDFTAYEDGATGLLDRAAGGLPSWVQAVRYDPEHWRRTPALEQGAFVPNPYVGGSFAERFTAMAASLGLRSVLSPGLDLCNDAPNPAYPARAPQYPAHGPNYVAYLRYGFATAAAFQRSGDLYVYQSQELEASPRTHGSAARFAAQVTAAGSQARAAAPGVAFLAGVGRTRGTWDGATGTQLAASMLSVLTSRSVDGFWLDVDATPTRVVPMVEALRLLVQAAG